MEDSEFHLDSHLDQIFIFFLEQKIIMSYNRFSTLISDPLEIVLKVIHIIICLTILKLISQTYWFSIYIFFAIYFSINVCFNLSRYKNIMISEFIFICMYHWFLGPFNLLFFLVQNNSRD